MFLSKLLERFSTYQAIKSLPTKSEPEIELENFIDFDLDCVGWYAMGHHNSQDFLASLSKKGVNIKPNPEIYHLTSVQRTWAKIDSAIGIEQIDAPSKGAVPITFVELFYD
jgi:hypothetical protein